MELEEKIYKRFFKYGIQKFIFNTLFSSVSFYLYQLTTCFWKNKPTGFNINISYKTFKIDKKET